MKVVMYGALGRMGRRIITLASPDTDIEITGAVDTDPSMKGVDIGDVIGIGKLGVAISNDLETEIKNADVVIDFSLPHATLVSSEICEKHGIALVVGTTGFSDIEKEQFLANVKNVPCVFAPNMSVGVNLLFKLVRETAAIIGEDYDVEITEIHHKFKKDAPSGTAKHIAEIIADTVNTPLEEYGVYGRQGITGERTQKEIGIHAIRAGDVVGEHTVTFGTMGERFELVHKLHSRDALASGAIRAAKFAATAQAGLYDMQDVLGLN